MKIKKTWFSTEFEITPDELLDLRGKFPADKMNPFVLIWFLLDKLTN